jgi:hypothetical protein
MTIHSNTSLYGFLPHSLMDDEVEKIDLRLDFLGQLALSEQFDGYRIQEPFVQPVS